MLNESYKALELFAPATRTASANGTGVDLNTIRRADAGSVVLHIGTVTGTSPTLDVKLQDSDDNSTFADVSGAVFAQKTATALSRMNVDLKVVRRYVRAVATIAGTTPSFPCSVVLLAAQNERPVAAQA